MNNAKRMLLSHSDLDCNLISGALDGLMIKGVDYGDVYFQSSVAEYWSMEDGFVKEGSLNRSRGVGVRAVSGDKTGFAYSDVISKDALYSAVHSARNICGQGERVFRKISQTPEHASLYSNQDPLQSISDVDKVALIQSADGFARTVDPKVSQVFVSLTGSYDVVLIAATDGTFSSDIRPLVRMNITVIVESNGQREQGSSGGGGRFGYEYFSPDRVSEYAREAVRQALVNLDAIAAPAGTMPVVLGAGWPGILLHEAVGHGLEGDFNRKGTSVFSGQIGQKVASEHCTIVDDGTIADRRGSLSVDDEGTPAQNTTLIENGVLVGYMQDKTNARLMGVESTGNGRRESYAHLPMPRMTNTYMLPGQHEHEEIIASVDKGIYAANFGGGQVDITSGKFVFSATEAYLIENGKITQPIKGATLIGSGSDTMTKVSMVGNNLELDAGMGTCGKEGQSVPVGVGQPTLKIDEMTVGGTAT